MDLFFLITLITRWIFRNIFRNKVFLEVGGGKLHLRVNYYVDVTISTNETLFQVFFIIIYIFHEWIIL